jgi:4-amino-4-deoxy-L-arabinose transferase-like glycosyltransferase
MSARAQSLTAIIIGCMLLVVFAATAWLACLDKCATVDEPGHIVGGWTQIQFRDFRFNCEQPALFQTIVGLGLPAGLFQIDRQSPQWQSLLINADAAAPIASQALYQTPGLDADTLLRAERARMLAIAVVIGIVIGWWAWRLAGPVAAVFAIAAFSFDPNFLAHGPLVKNDVISALAFLLFAASVWLFGQRVTVTRFLAVGLFMGLAFMVKFSGFLVIPILAILLLARSMIPNAWPVGPFMADNIKRRLAFSAGAILVGVLFVWLFTWASYDFRFLPSPGSSDQFDFSDNLRYFANHQAFAQSDDPVYLTKGALDNFWRHWRPPASVKLILFANAHRLFPQGCLAGLLRIGADSQARVAFLCGKSSVTGWWYYFPLAMLFKTPAATLIGLLAAFALMTPKLRKISPAGIWPLVAGAAPPAIFLLVAMSSNVNVGIRHILPMYPFLFIFLGVTAASCWNLAKRGGRLFVTLLTIALAAETAFAFPNFIPFFNLFAGGSRGGFRLLGESNIDWGQDLPALAAWQNRHPDRPLYLLYWGSADPRYYGIRYVNLPQSTAPADHLTPGPGRPVYAFSAVVLTNPFVRESMKGLFDSVLHQEPIAILNGSIYIYDAP